MPPREEFFRRLEPLLDSRLRGNDEEKNTLPHGRVSLRRGRGSLKRVKATAGGGKFYTGGRRVRRPYKTPCHRSREDAPAGGCATLLDFPVDPFALGG